MNFEIKVVVDFSQDVKELLMKLLGVPAPVPTVDTSKPTVKIKPEVAEMAKPTVSFNDIKKAALALREANPDVYQTVIFKFTKGESEMYSAIKEEDYETALAVLKEAYENLEATAEEEEELETINYDALRAEAKQMSIDAIKMDKGKRAEIKALTAKYKTHTILQITDDKIEAFIEELKELL